MQDRLPSAAVVMAPRFYSLVRILVDLIPTSHGKEAKLRAEVLALRRQVQVLERQIKRVRWLIFDLRVFGSSHNADSRAPSGQSTL